MAKVELNDALAKARGKFNKQDNTIYRQKKYRAENGAVISYGSQEAYEVRNPRDYTQKPLKGAELQNVRSFAEASRLTTLLIQSGKFTEDEIAAMPDALREQTLNLRQQLAQFKARFVAQHKKADPQAPILSKTDPLYNHRSPKVQRRQYRTLNTFIRAILLQSIRASK